MKSINYKSGMVVALAAASMAANAQTITFETQDYASLGVYDTWVDSPFRTGVLKGNVKVLDNHLTDESNPSAHILGVQRSLAGSNTFGAKIDLAEPWNTNPDLQYVHVMIHKPVAGRVMLIGLGKRSDRPDQSADVEQFWTYPLYAVTEGEWADAVFPVKTNGGVEIHSLVVVPHCEEPSTVSGDFAAYIDEIEINNNLRPRIGAEDYPANFDKTSSRGRSDRAVTALTFTTSSDGRQAISIADPQKLYKECFDAPIKVKAGGTVSTEVSYNGFWMHSYLYLDKDNDGEFTAGVDDDIIIDPSTDLVSFSLYTNGNSSQGKNSQGKVISSNANGFDGKWTPPTFTVPADMATGIYRMRYKLDWNNIDPGGDTKDFVNNGGVFVDFLLNVHADEVSVRQDNRNGEITLEDGTVINATKVPFGQPLTIKMVPSNGFTYSGVRIRHGYNLTGDSLVKSNPQYRDIVISYDDFAAGDTYTIPGELVDGDMLLEGLFVEEGTRPNSVNVTYIIMSDDAEICRQTFKAYQGDAYPQPNALDTEVPDVYYTLTGVPEGTVGDVDEEIILMVENNFPFSISRDINNASWYNLTLSANRNYLSHNPSVSYISLSESTTSIPEKSDHNAQWAFVGDVMNGFVILNRAAGEGYVLSSSTETSSNTGGNTYPVMTPAPVPSSHNTYWIPTVSTNLSGHQGFYLHQAGYPNNCMNKRDSRLAYWTGGADSGSTFIATFVETTSGIEGVDADKPESPRYYNLQGVEVVSPQLQPGIYIVRQGGRTSKVLVK